jgi:hypothetical protein
MIETFLEKLTFDVEGLFHLKRSNQLGHEFQVAILLYATRLRLTLFSAVSEY